ncbi:synaptotagmin-9 [Mugil cephalus]|uniref:synaptotagmin-9 n=1 Tax=Mugil cephalus TaxID=48193 RepID=UPI001FB7CF40|nr:synaptotagmin-9 [Mugil cephalus]
MLPLLVFPCHFGLLPAAGALRMPFSIVIKYSILGISVTLLLLALAILAWQILRFCTQTRGTYVQQGAVNTDLLYTEEKPTTAENYAGAPSTKEENVSTEAHRLSRCLSQAASSGCSPADGDIAEQTTIKKVDGTLRYSIYYDRLQSSLVVTVLQVEGLLEHSENHSLQPFVKVRLMWAGSEAVELDDLKDEEVEGTKRVLWTVLQEWRTRIVKGSCNPVFGDQFSCILQEDKNNLHHFNLRMEVRDFDKFSRHTVLGEVRVALGQHNITYPLELQEELQFPQKDLVGEVMLSLKFLPTSQRIEVGLLKVRIPLTETSSDSVLHARVSIQCNQSKLRYQKTSAVARCLVTVFNEVLMFSLPEFPLDQCKILVSMYETRAGRKSTRQMIGQLSVGKERRSEDEHWTLMMHSVRQPVAKWHGLML